MDAYDKDPNAGDLTDSIYTKFIEGKYHRLNYQQIKQVDTLDFFVKTVQAKFYYYDADGKVHELFTGDQINNSYTYYTRKPAHIYHDAERDERYKDQILYRMVSLPSIADESIIYNEEIEKFQNQEVHTFLPASEQDMLTAEKLYIKEEGSNKYTQLTGTPVEGTQYYILKIEQNMVSIGTKVEQDTTKGDIFYFPGSKTYMEATQDEKDQYYDFEKNPYEPEAPYGSPITLYWKEENWEYVEATENEIINREELGIELYYSTNYILLSEIEIYGFEQSQIKDKQLFIVVPMDTFVNELHFKPNIQDNYINGLDKPDGNFPKDDPIFIYTLSNFIPESIPENSDLIYQDKTKYYSYRDLKLANITLPSVVVNNGLDLPFKYDYTIVPCMNYGKLNHLAVSNTIDFSKLHAFNQSNFHTWKYRIDNNQLRLTFGTDIYDTYETYKVDGIILEFYDCWGFAGSLKIVDKKSYSGLFTKVISLNSFRTLSNKRVVGNTFTGGYKRNINLISTGLKQATLEGINENFTWNASTGWNIPEKHPKTGEELDDCGTIYSNIVYGVKTYLRRNVEGNHEYIQKDNFFLYTLPIYNEFYYTVQNFNNLTYPELQLVLTYKLKDTSTKSEYTGGEIEEGFNKTDKENIDSYLGGFYEQNSLDLIKYYKYTGQTDLYLEIGLKKDYEELNISYDPMINNIYSAHLQLISDNDKDSTYTVNSNVEGLSGISQILNYNNFISEDSNILKFVKFDNTLSNNYEVDNIYNSNFINHTGASPIKIKYEFIVGYTASITDIKSTQVQATTVCALFHKKPTGEYNYEDFGVYEQEDGVDADGNPVNKLLCNTMFYNEGTSEKEVFGICRQISTSGIITEQLRSLSNVETEAREIKLQGQLNSGEPLKQLVSHIGKLTFCQPHAHGLSEVNGVNIHGGQYNSYYAIPPEEGGGEYFGGDGFFGEGNNDDSWGIVPLQLMYSKPLYNLSLNTKNTINYYSEFISTIDHNVLNNVDIFYSEHEDGDKAWHSVKFAKEYTGFTGDQIATFNQKMIKTMSSIYAYNPDYDSLTVKVGNITLQNYNPNFTSNLLNVESTLNYKEGQTLNDFIYLGPIKFSDYLNQLYEYSFLEGNQIKVSEKIIENDVEIEKPLPQVALTENFDYCGTPENKYLISSLTYNTPVPLEIEQELEFTASNITVIKHTDGSNSFLQGIPNKKALYGYLPKYKKMLQLDVMNYTIAEDGTLNVQEVGSIVPVNGKYNLNSNEVNQDLFRGTHSFEYEIDSEGVKSKIRLGLTLGKYGMNNDCAVLGYKDNTFIIGAQSNWGSTNCGFTLNPTLYVSSSDNNYKYNVKINNLKFKCKYTYLNDDLSLWGSPIPLQAQSYETLQELMNQYGTVTLVDQYGNSLSPRNSNEFWITQDAGSSILVNNQAHYQEEEIVQDLENGIINIVFNPSMSPDYTNNYIIGLIEIELMEIDFTITQTSKLEIIPESFISTVVTRKYSQTKNHIYSVLPEYQNARFRGSSLTINDLVYSDSLDGHRLFIRNNPAIYDPYLRNKLYYRFLNEGNYHSSWHYGDTKYLNNLFLYTGPCYTESNL